MENIFYEGKVMWSHIDANNHMRHSAFADFAVQGRLELLAKIGFTADTMDKHRIGPLLFKEELIYLREVRLNDTLKVSCAMSKCRADGSRWSFAQEIYRSDGILAAQVNVSGAWINFDTRKLTALPQEFIDKMMSIPKTIDFVIEETPIKKV